MKLVIPLNCFFPDFVHSYLQYYVSDMTVIYIPLRTIGEVTLLKKSVLCLQYSLYCSPPNMAIQKMMLSERACLNSTSSKANIAILTKFKDIKHLGPDFSV